MHIRRIMWYIVSDVTMVEYNKQCPYKYAVGVGRKRACTVCGAWCVCVCVCVCVCGMCRGERG